MHPQRRLFLILNLVGGPAVLGSYAHAITTHAEPGRALWGSVPAAIIPLYNVSMLTAAAGYLAFAYHLFFGVDAAQARISRWGFGLINLLSALILAPSALWIGLTFAYLDHPSALSWAAVRVVLFLVGIGALGMIVALVQLRPEGSPRGRRIAIAGAIAFAFQTAVLDALVWPAFFRG
ncbi:MAG: hypothetical protein U0359_42350 [Byssovorax sp.]